MAADFPRCPLRPVLDLLEDRHCIDTCHDLGVPMSTVESWVTNGLTTEEAWALSERLEVAPESLWPWLVRMSPAEGIAAARAALARSATPSS